MAPASASPQPPSGRSDSGGRGESDPRERAPGQDESHGPLSESYGPLSVERQIKQDGRALILYARLENLDR